jgi:hypothetical protein
MVIFIYESADQQRDDLTILTTVLVPTATAPTSPHFDIEVVPVHRGWTEKLLHVTEAETENACTLHDITEYYSSAVFTLM